MPGKEEAAMLFGSQVLRWPSARLAVWVRTNQVIAGKHVP